MCYGWQDRKRTRGSVLPTLGAQSWQDEDKNGQIRAGKTGSERGGCSCQTKNQSASTLLPTLGAQSWQQCQRSRGWLLPGVAAEPGKSPNHLGIQCRHHFSTRRSLSCRVCLPVSSSSSSSLACLSLLGFTPTSVLEGWFILRIIPKLDLAFEVFVAWVDCFKIILSFLPVLLMLAHHPWDHVHANNTRTIHVIHKHMIAQGRYMIAIDTHTHHYRLSQNTWPYANQIPHLTWCPCAHNQNTQTAHETQRSATHAHESEVHIGGFNTEHLTHPCNCTTQIFQSCFLLRMRPWNSYFQLGEMGTCGVV